MTTPSDVFSNSTVLKDSYQSTTLIESPAYYQAQGVGGHRLSLQAKFNSVGNIAYSLQVQDSQASGWRFFDRAYDSNGKKLEFIDINHDVTLGITSETFAINLPRSYLENAATESINIKVFGENGEKLILVPNHYVEGFLQKIDAYLESK